MRLVEIGDWIAGQSPTGSMMRVAHKVGRCGYRIFDGARYYGTLCGRTIWSHQPISKPSRRCAQCSRLDAIDALERSVQ